MSSIKSNIRIKSNIYLRSPETCSDGDFPERDSAFAAQVFDETALKALKKRADESGVTIDLSDVQRRILNGEKNILASELRSAAIKTDQPEKAVEIPSVQAEQSDNAAEIPSVQAEQSDAAEIPSVQAEQPQKAVLEKVSLSELLERGFGSEKTAVLCANVGYAEYVSVLFHKNKIPHRLINGVGITEPVRQLADVLWDCHERVISRDGFDKRFTARCGSYAARKDEFFDTLCKFAGGAPSDGLDIGALARSIMRGGLPDALFGERRDDVTVAVADDVKVMDLDRVYVLENGYEGGLPTELLSGDPHCKLLSLSEGCPAVVRGAGRFAVVDGAGKAAVGVIENDVDRLSFIGGSVGDAVRKQAYISQNVKCGDAVRLELNGGVYDIVHNGMIIAKMSAAFSESILGEFGGKKYFAELPKSLGDLIVTKVITVVSCRSAEEFGDTVSPQFRDRNFWLGVEISGFAAEI